MTVREHLVPNDTLLRNITLPHPWSFPEPRCLPFSLRIVYLLAGAENRRYCGLSADNFEVTMPADAVAVPLTVPPVLPGATRDTGETCFVTTSYKRGIAERAQSRMNDAELIREAQRGNHAA